MEHPTILFQLQNGPVNHLIDNLGQAKLVESLSSLQNSSEVLASKLDEKSPNHQLQHVQKEFLKPYVAEKLQQLEAKIEAQDENSSDESAELEIKDVTKLGREQKFKRSTNNSHKKFISVARRWLFKNHRGELKVAFQNKFHNFRSTRTYFFIILAFIKTIMNEQKQRQFQNHFTKQVSLKISEYQKQIENTTNQNLKHFRSDEVTDLKFSIKACDVYFEGDLDKSIECVYKKDKVAIVKKHHYQEALKIVKGIESQFRDPNFLENTINMFGVKKFRAKSVSQESFTTLNQKEQKSRFFVAEMFGLKVGYVSETFFSSKKYSQIRFGNQNQSPSLNFQKFGVSLKEQNNEKMFIGGSDLKSQKVKQREKIKLLLCKKDKTKCNEQKWGTKDKIQRSKQNKIQIRQNRKKILKRQPKPKQQLEWKSEQFFQSLSKSSSLTNQLLLEDFQ